MILGLIALVSSVLLVTENARAGEVPSAEHSVKCGQITMSFHNPTPWLFVFDYRVDGEVAVSQSPWAGLEFNLSSPLSPGSFGDRWHLVPVGQNNNQDIVLNFGEDTGIHQVEYRLAEGAEQDMYFDWTSARVQSDCEVPTVLVCLDGDNELTIPRTTEAWDRVLFSYPDAYVGECKVPEPTPTPEPEPTVTPTEAPKSEPEDNTCHTCSATAPTCGETSPVKVAANPHVYRKGGVAIVKWFPTEGNNVNIYYHENQNPENAHAVRDSDNDGYEEIGELGNLDWTFGIQQSNGCAGGEVVWVIDGATDGWILFR